MEVSECISSRVSTASFPNSTKTGTAADEGTKRHREITKWIRNNPAFAAILCATFCYSAMTLELKAPVVFIWFVTIDCLFNDQCNGCHAYLALALLDAAVATAAIQMSGYKHDLEPRWLFLYPFEPRWLATTFSLVFWTYQTSLVKWPNGITKPKLRLRAGISKRWADDLQVGWWICATGGISGFVLTAELSRIFHFVLAKKLWVHNPAPLFIWDSTGLIGMLLSFVCLGAFISYAFGLFLAWLPAVVLAIDLANQQALTKNHHAGLVECNLIVPSTKAGDSNATTREPKSNEVVATSPKVALIFSLVSAPLHFIWPSFDLGPKTSVFIYGAVAIPRWFATLFSLCALLAIQFMAEEDLHLMAGGGKFQDRGSRKTEHGLIQLISIIASFIVTWDVLRGLWFGVCATGLWEELPAYESGNWDVEMLWLSIFVLALLSFLLCLFISVMTCLPLYYFRKSSYRYHLVREERLVLFKMIEERRSMKTESAMGHDRKPSFKKPSRSDDQGDLNGHGKVSGSDTHDEVIASSVCEKATNDWGVIEQHEGGEWDCASTSADTSSSSSKRCKSDAWKLHRKL